MPTTAASGGANDRSQGDLATRALETRQLRLVRVLLLALLAAILLILLVNGFTAGWGYWRTTDGLLLTMVAGLIGLALGRIRSRRLKQAVWLAVSGTFAILLSETIENGIGGGRPVLFAYCVPVAFAGLLVGRRALLLTSGLSIAAVSAVYLLAQRGVSWIGSERAQASDFGVVFVFALAIGLLALVLERFGVALEEAHSESVSREQELNRLVNELEHEIEERRQAEFERQQAEQEREALFEREKLAREQAEISASRLSFLARAGHLLSTSLDLDETLGRLTDLVVPHWADWCALDIVNSEGVLERHSVAHSDPRKLQWALELQESYPPGKGSAGAAAAVATGKTQYYPEADEELLRSIAQDDEHLRLLRTAGFTSAVMVPLMVRGESVGALTLVSAESGRRYEEEDVLFFEELATRAAAALENARLFAEVRSLNQDLERRVDQRTQELRDALSELETFAYSISHDLRAPLRGIDGFSQAMLEDYSGALDETAREYLGRIRAAAVRLGELIDDLLNLARLSQGELRRVTVDLSDVAATAVAELRSEHPDRQVEVEIEPDLIATGDRRLLRVVMENLIGNAWKFTVTEPHARIEIGSLDQEGERIFFVRDNGIGFEMSYADKLFVPFQRLHPPKQYEGTGIGLATVQRILRRHGGTIWAQGETGEGATFYFTLGE